MGAGELCPSTVCGFKATGGEFSVESGTFSSGTEANFEKVQKQYEVGLLKEVDRLAAEAELLQAEYQMFNAITNYQLKKWEFQQLLGMDLEV